MSGFHDLFSIFGGVGGSSFSFGSGSVINGVTIAGGRNVCVKDGIVWVDGKVLDSKLNKDLELLQKIHVVINVPESAKDAVVKTGSVGPVTVNGPVSRIETTNGQVLAQANVGSVHTTNGNVHVAAAVSGSVHTTNGNIHAASIGGRASSVNGHVHHSKYDR